jgi:hypothetical protein
MKKPLATMIIVFAGLAAASACAPLRFPELPGDGGGDAQSADQSTGEDDSGASVGADEDAGDPDADAGVEVNADADVAADADADVDADAEAGVDAGISDGGEISAATIHVERAGAGVAGVRVIFHGADGRVLTSTRTNVNGIASGDVGSSGMLTIVEELAGDIAFSVQTLAGVVPGDDLRYELRDERTVAWADAQLQAPPVNATRYAAALECTPPSSGSHPRPTSSSPSASTACVVARCSRAPSSPTTRTMR